MKSLFRHARQGENETRSGGWGGICVKPTKPLIYLNHHVAVIVINLLEKTLKNTPSNKTKPPICQRQPNEALRHTVTT